MTYVMDCEGHLFKISLKRDDELFDVLLEKFTFANTLISLVNFNNIFYKSFNMVKFEFFIDQTLEIYNVYPEKTL